VEKQKIRLILRSNEYKIHTNLISSAQFRAGR